MSEGKNGAAEAGVAMTALARATATMAAVMSFVAVVVILVSISFVCLADGEAIPRRAG